ncbi:ABC transporter substrate-binding protein [Streptomyces sp. NPDC050560]|uniref:ABC transporter substrate-binding protein n=1 Tax=Streptomyces sp. NPDC050560 TaxID=3365630 RepID=UPI0037980905
MAPSRPKSTPLNHHRRPHPAQRPRGRRLPRLAAGLAVCTLALTCACGAPPGQSGPANSAEQADSPQPWDKLTGSAREKALLKAAKKEGGRLSVYSSYNDEPKMAQAFTAKYGIKVDVYQANSESVLQRVQQETTAGKPRNDVLVSPGTDMETISDRGILGPYASKYRDAVPEVGRGKLWTGVRRLAFVAGWNTDLIKTADVPKSFEDFADPRWKGKISLEYSDSDWYATLRDYYLSKGMSKADVTTMFQRIAHNEKTVKGHTVQGDLMAAGQFQVALSAYTQTVERLKVKGAPVSYGAEENHLVSPVVVRYDAIGLMSGTPRPATATLYLDFQLGKDGFAQDEKLQGLPPVPQPDDPLAKAQVIAQDVPTYVKEREEAAKDYDALIRSGGTAK